MRRLHQIIVFIFVFLFSINTLAQKDSLFYLKPKCPIWFIPSKAEKVNGIAIGPIESGIFKEKQKVNGITVNILGLGTFAPLMPESLASRYFKDDNNSRLDSIISSELDHMDTIPETYIHNGLVASLGGIATQTINGISVSTIGHVSSRSNGILLNGLITVIFKAQGVTSGIINESFSLSGVQLGIFNKAVVLKGIQIGLSNKSLKGKGFQIGLINKNPKRTTILINWNFSN